MNTIQSLTEHGIEPYTAEKMIENYKSRIGTMNGMYEITDIEYDFDIRGRIVTLKCSECGKEIHRTMIKGRNKWSELIKNCGCRKEAERKREFKNREKIKKAKSELAEQKRIEREIKKSEYNPIKYDDSYIGNRYNFLEVVGITQTERGERRFICKCQCGNVKTMNTTQVVNGVIKSCGCMHDKLLSTHGLSNTRLYRILNGMKYRCYDEKSHAYDSYGGRGISICDEWLDSENGLRNFIEWALTHGYSDDLSIDRIDVNGNYEPNNCRWADQFVQANNKRPKSEWKPRKKKFEIDGAKHTLQELCRMYDTSEPAIRYRMKTLGMTLEQALKTPKLQNGRPRKAENQ